MTTLTRRFLLMMAVGVAAAQTVTAQGILMVVQEKSGVNMSTNRMQIDKDHMRAESRGPQGGQTVILFDAPKQVVRMVDMDKKSYMEMTKADMDQMAQQMNSAMSQMQEQLKNVPPEQRAIVEQMMRARGGAIPGAGAPQQPAKTQYRRTGTDKVGQWSCTTYDGYRGQDKVSSICAADPKDFGVTAADFEITRQLSKFLSTLNPQAADRTIAIGSPEDQGYSGVPVRTTLYANGNVQSTSEVTEFRRETFPASTFDVPAGFQKESPGARGRGR